MDVRKILEEVRSGSLSVEAAADRLKVLPFEDLGFATIDHHRELRNGCPEVIYCAGKTVQQVADIVRTMWERGSNVLATRATAVMAEAVQAFCTGAQWNETARTITVRQKAVAKAGGKILVITGGTADLPVAEEAIVTAEFLGNETERLYDVGVAGIHRLLARLDRIMAANVIIVVAGMEGALASVVGGLTDKPVIAVPTSVGYGASFGGVTALLAMLSSCANGVSVVNIDNGFGAGYVANSINRVNL
jgi:NCAIR mutase (PurE)-related protein